MANLRGVLRPKGKEGVSRLASGMIDSKLSTWEGGIETVLFEEDGQFLVTLNGTTILTGSVGTDKEKAYAEFWGR